MTTAATNKDPIFLVDTKNPLVEIDNSDGTTVQQIFTAGADGGAITELAATSTDTAAVIVVIGINNGTTSFTIGEVSVPAGSGTDGTTAAKNLLDTTALQILDADGSLILEGTFILEVNAKSAVTATKTVDIAGVAGNY